MDKPDAVKPKGGEIPLDEDEDVEDRKRGATKRRQHRRFNKKNPKV